MHSFVEVKVPATTANLGPGFDCLGMTLDLWNTVRIDRGMTGVRVTGEGADYLGQTRRNLVTRAASTVFRKVGEPVPTFGLVCHNEVPVSRGLGSSAAAVVGGLLATNALCGDPLSPDELLELAVGIEGHPDNVVPALWGGCRVSVRDGDRLVTSRIPVPEGLRAVLFIPEQAMSTARARSVLPQQVSREDAVFNVGRAALLASALASGDLGALKTATQDRLHQPQRGTIFPAMRLIIRAALDAGALGAFLSGAGSTILALAHGREMTIGFEMADIANRAGVAGEVRVVDVACQGAQIVRVG